MKGTTPVPSDVEEDGLGVQLYFGLDPDPTVGQGTLGLPGGGG
jgi:hypothetical protein